MRHPVRGPCSSSATASRWPPTRTSPRSRPPRPPGRALTAAVARANEAVTESVVDEVPNPPSCTFVAAVVEDGVVVAGNVGDSRAYWLPDADAEPARQLGEDDSFAQEQMAAGVPREEA